MGRLCDGLFALRRAELTLDVTDVDKARGNLERVVSEEPNWARGWYAVGRIRLAAAHAGMVGREGPLMQAGMSNQDGATRAFVRGLELDPSFGASAVALTGIPVPWTDKDGLRDRVTLLRAHRAQLPPAVLVDVASFELDAANVDTAIALLRGVLARGTPDVPRGYAQILLARALYRNNQPKEGRTALLAGASETDSAGLAAYREQLSWVGDSTEMNAWEKLSPGRRTAWLAAFWAERDIREGRKDGERLIEHYRRVNYAYEHYRMVQPASGEQTMLTDPDEHAYGRWLGIMGLTLPYTSAGYALARVTMGAQSRFRAFVSQQSVLDDRGLIYIRHGAPTRVARTIPHSVTLPDKGEYQFLGAPTIELWRYDRPNPEPPLILYFMNKPFMGSVEPNVLVPTLLAEDPETRRNLCDLDFTLCPQSDKLSDEIARISILEVRESRTVGMAYIKEAVTSDRFPREFAKALNGSFEVHVLDEAQGGSPRVVVAFAIPGQDLIGGTGDFTDDIFYTLRVQVMASRLSDGKRIDLDTLRHVPMTHTLVKGEFLSVLSELPLPPGRWTATIVISQAGKSGADDRGVKATIENLSVPDWSLNLAVSDMVLGRDDVGLRWHSGPGGQPVALNPLNTFPKGSTAALYAQIAGLTPEEPYEATIELFEGGAAKGLPKLTVKLSEVAHASRVELSRALGLGQLNPGRYLVQLTIKADGKSVVTTGGLEILK